MAAPRGTHWKCPEALTVRPWAGDALAVGDLVQNAVELLPGAARTRVLPHRCSCADGRAQSRTPDQVKRVSAACGAVPPGRSRRRTKHHRRPRARRASVSAGLPETFALPAVRTGRRRGLAPPGRRPQDAVGASGNERRLGGDSHARAGSASEALASNRLASRAPAPARALEADQPQRGAVRPLRAKRRARAPPCRCPWPRKRDEHRAPPARDVAGHQKRDVAHRLSHDQGEVPARVARCQPGRSARRRAAVRRPAR